MQFVKIHFECNDNDMVMLFLTAARFWRWERGSRTLCCMSVMFCTHSWRRCCWGVVSHTRVISCRVGRKVSRAALYPSDSSSIIYSHIKRAANNLLHKRLNVFKVRFWPDLEGVGMTVDAFRSGVGSGSDQPGLSLTQPAGGAIE